MKKLLAICAIVALVSGCSAMQSGGEAPKLDPVQQCALTQSLTLAAQVAVNAADDGDVKEGLEVALAGVRSASASFCDAVAKGESVDSFTTFLVAFNAALADLNERL